jgi:hypothetical protein
MRKRLLRCSRCKTVYFCDRACQKAGHARHRLRCGSLAQMVGDEVTKRQLSDMDPLTMMMADLSFGIQSPESDAYLRAAFDRGVVTQQTHQNAAMVASQVASRIRKG